MKSNIANEIIRIIKTTIDESGNKIDVEVSTKLEELEIDSMSFIQIIVDIEDYFTIEFPMDAMASDRIKTIDDLIMLVNKTLNV